MRLRTYFISFLKEFSHALFFLSNFIILYVIHHNCLTSFSWTNSYYFQYFSIIHNALKNVCVLMNWNYFLSQRESEFKLWYLWYPSLEFCFTKSIKALKIYIWICVSTPSRSEKLRFSILSNPRYLLSQDKFRVSDNKSET